MSHSNFNISFGYLHIDMYLLSSMDFPYNFLEYVDVQSP